MLYEYAREMRGSCRNQARKLLEGARIRSRYATYAEARKLAEHMSGGRRDMGADALEIDS